jgi:hypothetical protein
LLIQLRKALLILEAYPLRNFDGTKEIPSNVSRSQEA